jgi:hypothetical protein
MTIRSAIPLLFCIWLSACSGGGAELPTQPLATISPDRAGLIALVPAYLAALIEHDTSWIPLADNAVLVENTQRLKAGEGLWQTASGASSAFRIVVADPVSSQVGAIVRMEENGMPIALGLRLQVQDGRVVAMEHVVARGLSEAALDNLDTPRAGFTTEIPEAQRLSRDELLHVAFSYYTAVDDNDGSLAPFADDCVRRENGMQTTGNPVEEGATGSALLAQLGCTAQLDSGAMAYIDLIDNRRMTIADPVTGTVFGLSQFRHSMQEKTFPITGVDGLAENTVDFEPFDLAAAHVVKVGPEGMIHEIEAVGAMLPYGSRTGWGW